MVVALTGTQRARLCRERKKAGVFLLPRYLEAAPELRAMLVEQGWVSRKDKDDPEMILEGIDYLLSSIAAGNFRYE